MKYFTILFRFVVLLQHESILFIVSNHVSNSTLYVNGTHAWFILFYFLFFNLVAFKMSPWIPRNIWCVRVIIIYLGYSSINDSMTFNVNVCCRPSSHFCGAGNVLCLSVTPTMTIQTMQTCTVVNVVFSPRHPPAERIHILPNTHKDTHI